VLVRLLPGGEPEEEHALPSAGVVSLGRQGCDLNFPEDELLADRHASLAISAAGAELRDEGGASGVFLRLPPAVKRPVEVGDLLRAGRQFLLVGEDGGHFVLQHYDAAGREVSRYPLLGKTAVVGRQAPDITLDAGDRSLSRRHFALNVDGGQLLVRDLKSANGTELRVRDAVALQAGDRFRVGRQTFAFATGGDLLVEADERTSTGAISVVRAPAAPVAPVAAKPASSVPAFSEPSSSEPTVTLSSGETFAVAPGQTLCEAAEAAGLTFNAECHSGICGSDPIRILKGLENVDGEPGAQECETLEDLCELQPGSCRLACMVRLKGSVTVERL
jgi:ferredoxin